MMAQLPHAFLHNCKKTYPLDVVCEKSNLHWLLTFKHCFWAEIVYFWNSTCQHVNVKTCYVCYSNNISLSNNNGLFWSVSMKQLFVHSNAFNVGGFVTGYW